MKSVGYIVFRAKRQTAKVTERQRRNLSSLNREKTEWKDKIETSDGARRRTLDVRVLKEDRWKDGILS